MLCTAIALCLRAETIELGYSRKAGSTVSYATKIHVEVKGNPAIDVSAVLTEKVTAASATGYELDATVGEAIVRMGGQQLEQPSTTVHRVFGADGCVTALSGPNVDVDSYRRQLVTQIYLPARAYKFGETWTHDSPANKVWGTPKVEARYRLVGREADGVHIAADFAEKDGKNPIKCHVDAWLDPTDGVTNRLSFRLENLPIRDVDRVATMTTEQKRKG